MPNGLFGGVVRERLTLLLDVQEQDLRLRGSLRFQNDSWSALKFVPNALLCAVATADVFVLNVKKNVNSLAQPVHYINQISSIVTIILTSIW
jgi:branched-subunit amino acid transport protein